MDDIKAMDDPALLAAGLRAAAQLQTLPVPPALAKQVANYILRAGNELASRGWPVEGRRREHLV